MVNLIKNLVIWNILTIISSIAWAGHYEDILAAAHRNDTETVLRLVERGMDINTSDPSGTSLLMIAASNGNESLLDILLKNRVNAQQKNKYGDTATTLAALNGHLAVLKRLMESGMITLSSSEELRWEPIHYAAFGGHLESVRYLISKNVSLNIKAPNGQTALMLASRNGHLEVVRALLEAGADSAY